VDTQARLSVDSKASFESLGQALLPSGQACALLMAGRAVLQLQWDVFPLAVTDS
jgi:hypothetical protein